MMASYRFALYCNRSCSLGLSLSPHLLSLSLSLREEKEGRREAVLVAGPKTVAEPSPERLSLWATLRNQEELSCNNTAFYEHFSF